MKKMKFKDIWRLLKDSFAGFSDDKVTKLSASLAYYTVFSMGPLLILIISICGIFLGREAMEGEVYRQLEGFMGADTAKSLQDIIKNAAISGGSTIAIIIGAVTLLVGATTVFAEIQDSINTIWGLKPKPKLGLMKMLLNRFLSFSVIVSLVFILLVSLGVTWLIEGLSDRLFRNFEDTSVIIVNVVGQIITLVVISFIFGVIFKVLPDAKIKWRDVALGSIVTAVLFMIGKFGISFYISKSNVGSTYGAAGSLVVLLLWTYYSSIILYFGAEFTKAYAMDFGSPIHPNHYAVTTRQVEVETGDAPVQANADKPTTVKEQEKKS
jgi:membrane protein